MFYIRWEIWLTPWLLPLTIALVFAMVSLLNVLLFPQVKIRRKEVNPFFKKHNPLQRKKKDLEFGYSSFSRMNNYAGPSGQYSPEQRHVHEPALFHC